MPGVILSVAAGAAAGFLQFVLLSKLVDSLAKKSSGMAAFLVVLELLVPAAVLVADAFICRRGLLWCAVALTAVLIICSAIKAAVNIKSGKKGDSK